MLRDRASFYSTSIDGYEFDLPDEVRQRLLNVTSEVPKPFNDPRALKVLYVLGKWLLTRASQYKLIVGEGNGSRFPAAVMHAVLNHQRAALGLNESHLAFVDGDHGDSVHVMTPEVDLSVPEGQRRLLFADAVNLGGSVQMVYGVLKEHQPPANVDVVAIAMHKKWRPDWLEGESLFASVGGAQHFSLDRYFCVQLGSQDPTARDYAAERIAQGLLSLYAQPMIGA